MADADLKLDGLMEPLRDPMREYCDLVTRLGGDKVASVTVYGAAVSGAFDATRHNVHSVLVLDGVDLDFLRVLSEHGAKLGKHRIAAPLIMTAAYIDGSLDTFPLELIEIQQMHLTVLGDDPFATLTFEDAHVRLQCERELKTVLIGMRRGLLVAAGRDKFLEAMGIDAAEGLVRTLRGMLWLKGKKESKPSAEVVSAVEELTDLTLDGVRTALDPAGPHGWGEFQKLYRNVEALAEVANAW